MFFADSLSANNLVNAIGASLVFGVIGIVALILFTPVFWRVIDRMTPGDLNDQLVPSGLTGRQPNMALAIVVGSMIGSSILGVSLIIAACVH